ncbi:unnamed protein product [Owenia fusiformis]|uniref:Uncharacterized protein n=1 Tax=Owenia fusiformis TaxID=6347 RepID=A0A8J1USG8_OWEFU|nr:unnamed protein product [Owenia fusiformis]
MDSDKENLRLSDISMANSGTSLNVGTMGSTKGTGCYISRLIGFILAFLVVAVCVCVGLIVHFAAPGRKLACECNCGEWNTVVPPLASTMLPPSTDRLLGICQNVSTEIDTCFCPKPKPPEILPPPTPPTRPDGLRLPTNIIPSHYNIELQPNVYAKDENGDFQFTGKVDIKVTCVSSTDQIILHIDELTVNSVSIKDSAMNEVTPAGWSEDKERHFLVIDMGSRLPAGEYTLGFTCNGSLVKSSFRGLFLSSYKTKQNETRYLAATQFETTYLRKVFPCFDEPALKATYDVTLVRKSHFSSISNMEIKEQINRDDDWVADVYKTTVKMSPYLLAFVVSDFKSKNYTTKAGTFFRHWARPDYVDEGLLDYSLGVSGRILEFFEDYTGVKYPLNKTDQIALPDFRSGAMENWGLVTYRETLLLYTKAYVGTNRKMRVTGVIAHELAHQWFGNLVTCAWWSDTWVNEAWATFMTAPAVDNLTEVNWKYDDEFVLRQRVQPYLVNDGGSTSQPIYVKDIEHHIDVRKAFSGITYNKGGSVIRMMRDFLGEDVFKACVNKYLTKFAYKPAFTEDLYEAFQEAIDTFPQTRLNWDSSKVNFTDIMNTWIRQMGYPVIDVTKHNNGVTLTQKHFLYNESEPLSEESIYGDYLWHVPLTRRTPNEEDYIWMYRDREVNVSTWNDDTWMLFNVDQKGFYRVNYDAVLWGKLVMALKSNNSQISVQNRAQLVDDSFNLAKAGQLDYVIALRTTEYLKNEREYIPWAAALTGLTEVETMLRYTEAYTEFREYVLDRLLPVYNLTGWNNSDPVEHQEKYLRSNMIAQACKHRHQPCLNEASKLFDDWMNTGINDIHPDFRGTVYCEAVQNGGWSEWSHVWDQYNRWTTDYIEFEKDRLRRALACTREPWILKKYLAIAVEKLNAADSPSSLMVREIASRDIGKGIVWNYIQTNWGTINRSRSSILSTITSGWNTQEQLQMLKSLIERYPGTSSSEQSALNRLVVRTRHNIKWMENNYMNIHNFLISANKGGAESSIVSEGRTKRNALWVENADMYPIEDDFSSDDNAFY